jgi:hypothetical protein
MHRLLSLLCLAALLPGCATTWAVLEVTGASWSQGQSQHETPLSADEAQLQVSPRYEAPPPEPPAPPPAASASWSGPTPPPMPRRRYVPVPTPYAPAPSPSVAAAAWEPPPPAKGALRFDCEVQQRPPRVHVSRELYRYDGVWKAITGLMFLAEGAMAAVSLSSGLSSDHRDLGVVAVGGFFGLDALGTAILFWHPEQTVHEETDGEGTWRSVSKTCPVGLSVDTPQGPVAVRPDGTVGDAGPALLNVALDGPDVPLQLHYNLGDRVPLSPSSGLRCDWARAAGTQRDFCRTSGGWSSSRVTVPMPLEVP